VGHADVRARVRQTAARRWPGTNRRGTQCASQRSVVRLVGVRRSADLRVPHPPRARRRHERRSADRRRRPPGERHSLALGGDDCSHVAGRSEKTCRDISPARRAGSRSSPCAQDEFHRVEGPLREPCLRDCREQALCGDRLRRTPFGSCRHAMRMPIQQTWVKSVRLATPCRLWYRSGVVRARAPTRAPGKAVRIRRDPVTVIGDETRESHWPRGREGAGSRTIREPGDLPARALFDSVFAGGPGRGFDDSRSRRRA